MARDYNRGVSPPVRVAHAAAAWMLNPMRRDWALPLVLGVVGVVGFYPWDGAISTALRGLDVSGDVRRELYAWQQFGALGSILLVIGLIWLMDPARQRRLLDLGAAMAVVWGSVAVMKLMVGRPRPRETYDDPSTILWPWGQYPVIKPDGQAVLLHAWEPAAVRSADLWSMPSSHVAAAVVLAVFLIALYPRIRPIVLVLAAVVGVCRVLFGAHWPTDVIVGTAVGFAGSQVAIGRFWGVRSLDWVWRRVVDRRAEPALAQTLATERARGGMVDQGGAWGWWWTELTVREAERSAPWSDGRSRGLGVVVVTGAQVEPGATGGEGGAVRAERAEHDREPERALV